MKKAEDCNTIEDIRACIDEIDRNIVENLVNRASYVKVAAKFKKTVTDVRATDRVESMIKTRKVWASEGGISPDFIESIFRKVVNHFIGRELQDWRNDEDTGCEIAIDVASKEDAGEILLLQKRAFLQEVEIHDNNYNIPPMQEDINCMQKEYEKHSILKATINKLIVGSVRAKQVESICYIGRLIVEPIYQKRGIGRKLLKGIENHFSDARIFELFTGVKSVRNRELYKNAGYNEMEEYNAPDGTRLVRLRKIKT